MCKNQDFEDDSTTNIDEDATQISNSKRRLSKFDFNRLIYSPDQTIRAKKYRK